MRTKILIFKVNQLGDNVVFLPVVQALKKYYPKWELSIYTSPVAKELYSFAPDGNIQTFATSKFVTAWKSPFYLLDLLIKTRIEHPTACLVANDQGNTAHLLARLSGARVRTGSLFPFLRFDPHLTEAVPIPAAPHAAMLGWNIAGAMVKHLGGSYWPDSPPSPDLSHLVRGRTPVLGRIVIHPGASQEYQRWPIDRFIELAELLARNFEVLWISSPEIGQLSLPKNIQIVQPKTISELTQTVASANLFIGNNSGPMNIAFALGTPCVIINGPTTSMWDPFWYPERALMLRDTSLKCLPCDTFVQPKLACFNFEEPLACLKRWSVESIYANCVKWIEHHRTTSA